MMTQSIIFIKECNTDTEYSYLLIIASKSLGSQTRYDLALETVYSHL